MNRLDELISRFLDDGLPPEERLELQHAIETDPQGADELLAYYQQDRLLAALFRPASADAVNAILAAVSAEDGFVDSVMRQARAATDLGSRRRKEAELCGETGYNHPPPYVGGYERPGFQTGAKPKPNWFAQLFPWPRWAFAVATVALIGLLVWLFPSVNNEPTLTVATGARVTLERNGQSLPAQDGMKLLPGDMLRISGSNGAAIRYGKENTRVKLIDRTELKTLAWQKGKRFELRQGKLEATVARQRPFGAMVLLTAQAEARVLGTEFTLAATTNATRLEVTEGKVKLTRTRDDMTVKVPAGYYAIAATNTELAALPTTGRILCEVWTNYPGAFMTLMTSDETFSKHPNDWEYLTRFETPPNAAIRSGERVRGYVHPPMTGEYRFSIGNTGSGEAFLFLSPDDQPENRVQIREVYSSPGTRPSPPPTPITLVAGRKYFIEALHESDTGKGHFTVRWQGPDREREVIPGEYLSPAKSKGKEKKR